MTVTSLHINRRLDKLLAELDAIKALIIQLQANMAANADELLPDSTLPGQEQRARTGYRMVRGTHSCHYVRDNEGTDPLPRGYTLPENAA